MNKILFNSEHINVIRNLTMQSDELIIVSPFLSKLKSFNIADYNVKLKLYTQISENIKDSVSANKYLFLENLINSYQTLNNDFVLFNIENLHSKIYLFKKNKKLHNAIITSANCTNAGLEGTNKECGVQINDDKNLKMIDDYIRSLNSCVVDKNDLLLQIKNIKSDIRRHLKCKKTKNENFDIQIKQDKKYLMDNIFNSKGLTIWLKPLGKSKEIQNMTVKEIENFISLRKQDNVCQFKDNTQNIKVGDILIFYVVKVRKVICIRKVTEPGVKENSNWNWPWNVGIEKIDGIYDLDSTDNYKIYDLLSDFLYKYPNSFVDKYNNKNFKQIRRQDRLELTKEFGKSAIESYINHQNILF